MFKARRNREGCAYCGATTDLTRDHVIAACLFPRPLPSNTLTVPACAKCNGEKSKHDDFLRDVLVTDLHGATSPIAQEVAQRTYASAIKGKSLLTKIMLERYLDMPIIDEDGTVHGVASTFVIEGDRMDKTFELIIRGLRFAIDGYRFPVNTEFITKRLLYKRDFQSAEDSVRGIKFDWFTIGKGVFECGYAIANDNPSGSMWFLEFYERVPYMAFTRLAKRGS